MSDLMVTSVNVEDLLKKLRSREWLIPQFQREFVWSVADVIDLVRSILSARPIGMATLWSQPDDSDLELDAIRLPDRAAKDGPWIEVMFADTQDNPKKVFALLDGRQRCQAVAMAFGGLRSQYGGHKFAGRYYLNVSQTDPLEQLVFKKETEIQKKGYDTDAKCIAGGLFPLASNTPGESVLTQWMRYIQAIRDPGYYSNGQLPDPKELDRRDSILKRAFDGIIRTKLAVYIVPESYDLSDICEIFETLNTTGTKVSTVDLIHSWLYSDTKNDVEGPVCLRDWIADFGQKDGAIGWASPSDRPELTVQLSTACYIALEEKPQHRKVKGVTPGGVASVKAGDLLATPTAHWKNLIGNDQMLAGFLGDFQKAVAGGLFPWHACPYPVTHAIYVALRYHATLDAPETHPWGRDDLDAVFRAFFWRNALTGRYDQGFLTQLGTDIREIKGWLNMRQHHNSSSEWATKVDSLMARVIGWPLPYYDSDADQTDWLIDELTDGLPSGAMRLALMLPMVAGADKDLLDENRRLGYPEVASGVQMHHIYPKTWCQNNKVGALADVFDKDRAEKDWVNSIANLMPLSRQSNNLWKAKNPAQILQEKGINYTSSQDILKNAYIDEECFAYLAEGGTRAKDFWERRATLIAKDLIKRTEVVI